MVFKKIKAFFSGISIDCIVTCIYFLCTPFTIVSTPFGSLLKIITMPVAAVLAYKTFFGERKPIMFNSVHFFYSLYIIYTVCGLFFLITEINIVQIKDMILTFAVIMLISMRVYNEKEQELIEHSWVLVGLVCAYLCISSTQVANEFENRTVVSIFGFKEDPNQFCAYFILPAVICVKRILQKRRFYFVYIAMIIVMLYAVLKTGSRGGLIGIVAGIAFCVFLGAKSFKAKISFVFVSIICAFLVVTVIFPLLPQDVQSRYSVQSIVEDKGTGRFEIWKYLIEYTAEKPSRIIHGSGLLSTYPILEKANIVDFVGVAHNQFVQVFTDQGIIGLMLFIALIFVCIFRNTKNEPYYACAFISVMALSVSLSFYVFKPYINIIIMCAMNFERKNLLSNKEGAY